MLNNKNILLIISGGIAAYKSLEVIRGIKKSGGRVRCILTKGGEKFVTPLSVAALSEDHVYTDLWSLKDETEMGHIRLSRECDLIVVAPASANIIAKMAHGLADDLATATLLASDKPVMICPAMNPQMWENEATKANIEILRNRGVMIEGPASGEMACGEVGHGRLLEPEQILSTITGFFLNNKPLAGLKALVTAGPTFEPIDPVRFVANRSSGKQGYAIAQALGDLGAAVTLVSGPVSITPPKSVELIRIETAREMLEICQKSLPLDIAVFAAAVADWTPQTMASSKLKKTSDTAMTLNLVQNPDILATIAGGKNRPRLVIGFAAETDDVLSNAQSKLLKKGCDWIVANAVTPENPVFGSESNTVHLVTKAGIEDWPRSTKDAVAKKLATRIAAFFEENSIRTAAE